MIASVLLLAASAASPTAEPVAPVPDKEYALQVNRRARGFGLGLAQGYWGGGFGQSLRADIPFGRRVGQFVGLRVHGTIVHTRSELDGGGDRWDPAVFGGAELFGRSPVMAGLLRMYGGGGLFFGGRPMPTPDGATYGLGGGGHFGLEAFLNPRMSFTFEVGGQAPVHGLAHDAGAHVLGGVHFYFGG